jgi:hypothetical protein
LRVKLVAALLLATPLIFPIASFADEEMEIVPPAKMETGVQTQEREPIDFSKIEITTLTPADKFVNATTPLVIALAMGSVALVAYTLQQGARERDGE